MNDLVLVTNENGVAMTTSLKIADMINKKKKKKIK